MEALDYNDVDVTLFIPQLGCIRSAMLRRKHSEATDNGSDGPYGKVTLSSTKDAVDGRNQRSRRPPVPTTQRHKPRADNAIISPWRTN
jgi:hypothetical protein